MSSPTIVVLTSGTTWVVPADWNSADNSISCIGAGGGGTNGSNSADGGGGGAFAQSSNVALTPGTALNIVIGQGGTGAGTAGTAGGDTVFGGTTLTSCIVGAQGGQGGSGTGTGPGGSTAASVGQIVYAGGNGGAGPYGPSGGGGAGGPHGAGADGGAGPQTSAATPGSAGGGGGGGGTAGAAAASTTVGGTGGNNYAGTGGGAGGTSASPAGGAGSAGGGGGGGYPQVAVSGGAGGNGNDLPGGTAGAGGGGGGAGWQTGGYQGGNGGLYGGGGGSDSYGGTGGTGGQGVIVIQYTANPPQVNVKVGAGHFSFSKLVPDISVSAYPAVPTSHLSLTGLQIIQQAGAVVPVHGLRLSGHQIQASAGTGFTPIAGVGTAHLTSAVLHGAGYIIDISITASNGHLTIAGHSPVPLSGHAVSAHSGDLNTTGKEVAAYLNVMSVPVQTGRMNVISTSHIAATITADVKALPPPGILHAGGKSPSTITDNTLTAGHGSAHLSILPGISTGTGIERTPVPGRISLHGHSITPIVEISVSAANGRLTMSGATVREDLSVQVGVTAGRITANSRSVVADVEGLAAPPLAHAHLLGTTPTLKMEVDALPRTGMLVPSGTPPKIAASSLIPAEAGHLTVTGGPVVGRLGITAHAGSGNLHVAQQIALGHASVTTFPAPTIADISTGAIHSSVADIPTAAGTGRLRFAAALSPHMRVGIDPTPGTATLRFQSAQQAPHIGSSAFADLFGIHLAGLKSAVTISVDVHAGIDDLDATGMPPAALTMAFPTPGQISSSGDIPTPFTSTTVYATAGTGMLSASGIRPALVGYTIVLGQGFLNLSGTACGSIVYGRPYPAGQYVLGEPEITTVTGC